MLYTVLIIAYTQGVIAQKDLRDLSKNPKKSRTTIEK
jgi:hypothetical protein